MLYTYYHVLDEDKKQIPGLTGDPINDPNIINSCCTNGSSIMDQYATPAMSEKMQLAMASGQYVPLEKGTSYIDEYRNEYRKDRSELGNIRPARLMSSTDMWADPAFKDSDDKPIGMGLNSWTTNYKIDSATGKLIPITDDLLHAHKNYEPLAANAFVDMS
jgi:hypothetical protein